MRNLLGGNVVWRSNEADESEILVPYSDAEEDLSFLRC